MKYRITRWCCLSGMCLDCRAKGDKSKRKRIVQADGLTKKVADAYMYGWVDYEPRMEKQITDAEFNKLTAIRRSERWKGIK